MKPTIYKPSIYKGAGIYKAGAEAMGMSLNLNDYTYTELINDIVYKNGFNRRGTADEYVRYYPELGLLSFNLFVVKNSIIPITNLNDPWISLFSLINDEFYFSDFITSDQKPEGVLGMFNSSMLSQGMCLNDHGYYLLANSNIVSTAQTDETKCVSMKNLIDPNGICRGAPVSRSFAVIRK